MRGKTEVKIPQRGGRAVIACRKTGGDSCALARGPRCRWWERGPQCLHADVIQQCYELSRAAEGHTL